jgi:hypothetical protein
MDHQEHTTKMADIMVQARRNNEDVGELIAAALQTAAEKLGDAGVLVQGRTGSWEADIVMRMAKAGGSGDEKRIAQLASLFELLSEGDGGDTLSYAMGKAVDELGGLKAFAGKSQWYNDLVNIGSQYSGHSYSEAFE